MVLGGVAPARVGQMWGLVNVGVWDAAFVFLRSTRFIGEVEIWSGAGACHMSVFKVSTYVQKILWVCLECRMFCLLLLKIDFRRNVALRQSRKKTWKGAWSVWNSKERGYSEDAAIDTIHYHALSAVLVMLMLIAPRSAHHLRKGKAVMAERSAGRPSLKSLVGCCAG